MSVVIRDRGRLDCIVVWNKERIQSAVGISSELYIQRTWTFDRNVAIIDQTSRVIE